MSYTYTAHDKRVLAWCNRIRAKLGKKPVRYIRKGMRDKTCDCPLANTIGDVSLGTNDGNTNTDWREDRMFFCVPRVASAWIRDFDTGKLPHFIAKGDSHA